MGILQVNMWTCEVCGSMWITQENVSPYSDPVVAPPESWRDGLIDIWDYVVIDDDEKMACPQCYKEWSEKNG